MYGENIDLNKPKFGLKKIGNPIDAVHTEKGNSAYSPMSIKSIFQQLLRFGFLSVNYSALPETRRAINEAKIIKETASGTAEIWVRKQGIR